MTKKKKDLSRIFTTDGGCVKTVFLIFFFKRFNNRLFFSHPFSTKIKDKIVFQYFVSEPWLINVLGLRCRERPTIDIYIPDIIELKVLILL